MLSKLGAGRLYGPPKFASLLQGLCGLFPEASSLSPRAAEQGWAWLSGELPQAHTGRCTHLRLCPFWRRSWDRPLGHKAQRPSPTPQSLQRRPPYFFSHLSEAQLKKQLKPI